MTTRPEIPAPARATGLETFRLAASRAGLAAIVALLTVGMVLSSAGNEAAPLVLASAIAVLLAVPIIGLVTLLVDVTWRREWQYARAALIVVLLILYGLIRVLALWAAT